MVLTENTVQHTLCMPLWGRKIAAETYPHIFPDYDAGRICQELGVDWSDKAMYKLQYAWINCMTRQYNLAWEINEYLKKHPNAIVVELGAGLSCLRRQMNNTTNRWYRLYCGRFILLFPEGTGTQAVLRYGRTFSRRNDYIRCGQCFGIERRESRSVHGG